MGCCLLSERIEPLVLASLPVTSPCRPQAWCDRHHAVFESKAGEQNETGEQTGEQNHVLLLFSEGNSNPFIPPELRGSLHHSYRAGLHRINQRQRGIRVFGDVISRRQKKAMALKLSPDCHQPKRKKSLLPV